jgi:uncharacterized membrane protein
MNDVKVWWQSKIIWAQVLAILFAIADTFGLKLSEELGLTQEGLLATVMTVIGVFTIFRRTQDPKQLVKSDTAKAIAHTQAQDISHAADGALTSVSGPAAEPFSGEALRQQELYDPPIRAPKSPVGRGGTRPRRPQVKK